jgi:hypothetical protein
MFMSSMALPGYRKEGSQRRMARRSIDSDIPLQSATTSWPSEHRRRYYGWRTGRWFGIHLYRSGSVWTERQKLAQSDPFNGDRLGGSIALSFGNLVVGAAEKALTSPNGQGAIYYFTSVGPPHFSITTAITWQTFRSSVRRTDSGGISKVPTTPSELWRSARPPISLFPLITTATGKQIIAIYRPSTGEWFVLRSSNLSFFSLPFGISTDKPSPGDFDGDGMADITVFRSSEGTWYINKTSGGIQITQWGAAGDLPENRDYDADGKSDFAIFRPSDGSWWINRSTGGFFATTFGVGTDKPVPADYTGDGKTDIAVWRPATGSWYILRSEDSSFFAIPFGATGDLPAAADFDGDGKADFAIFRPDGANWFIQRSTTGILIQQFGSSGDIPTEGSYVP